LPSFQELVVLFVIGLCILGPERLPRVAIQIGSWVGWARRTANQLRFQIEREIALADINENNRSKPDEGPGSNETPESRSQVGGPAVRDAVPGEDDNF
jgi:sec-independent protein translocase protein TatB